jgi:hypothetical protein
VQNALRKILLLEKSRAKMHPEGHHFFTSSNEKELK